MPEIWNETVVAEAPPVIVLVATKGCFRSMKAVVFPAIGTLVARAVFAPAVPIPRVNVPAVEVVFATAMLVTIQVVEAGTVPRTVVVVVVAAPRKKVVGVVAIVAP
jgi:hypothetical protein